jgi:hypothetical protein
MRKQRRLIARGQLASHCLLGLNHLPTSTSRSSGAMGSSSHGWARQGGREIRWPWPDPSRTTRDPATTAGCDEENTRRWHLMLVLA